MRAGMRDVDIGDVKAMMMPRVGAIAGDGQGGCRRGETHGTATKPPTGFGT
jgi:hypothetical protein